MISYKYTKTNTDADKIRQAVFLDEQAFSAEFYPDDDKTFDYVIAYFNSEPIGVVRIKVVDGRGLLGRLAVLKEHRHRRIGSKLVIKAEEKMKELNADEVHLHAQQHAIPFYEKLGYVGYGEFEMDEHTPHRWMKKEI